MPAGLWQQTALMVGLSTTPRFQALRATGPQSASGECICCCCGCCPPGMSCRAPACWLGATFSLVQGAVAPGCSRQCLCSNCLLMSVLLRLCIVEALVMSSMRQGQPLSVLRYPADTCTTSCCISHFETSSFRSLRRRLCARSKDMQLPTCAGGAPTLV